MRVRRALVSALFCLSLWSGGSPRAAGPVSAHPRYLVVVDAPFRETLRQGDVPVLWKGADFLLAEWTGAQLLWAQEHSIDFEIVAFDLDERYEIRLFELEDDAAPPAEWAEGALFHRGRKWVVAVPAGAAEPEFPAHSIVVSRAAREWAAPAGVGAFDCGFDPLVFGLLAQMDEPRWLDWVEKLSGAEDITVGGQDYVSATRYSPTLFSGGANARAFDFAVEQVGAWGYAPANIEVDPYGGLGGTWDNLVLTIPGQTLPGEVVMLTAHFDSIAAGTAATLAPGADDNGTGSATLLEAARLLRQYRFARSIRIVWFTGEEEGLLGSEAYVADHATDNVVGVVNIDMIGYDNDQDRCFEIHAGTMPASQAVGTCLEGTIQKYALNLPHDFLTTGATDRSDHASFWQVDVGAIAVIENFFSDGLPGGCVGGDQNPFYHTNGDTIANLAPGFGISIAKAIVGTVAKMALPIESCFDGTPALTATPGPGSVDLAWSAVAGAASYRVLRSTHGCDGPWRELTETTAASWVDGDTAGAATLSYEVEAVDADGFCTSAASDCASAAPLAAPPGEPAALTVARTPSGDLVFDWSAPEVSCQTSGYAVYRGDLNDLRATGYSHDAALACANGATTLSLSGADPRLGEADYFLVVAENGLEEGSYGRASSEVERPASAAACRATQDVTSCSP